jgi:transposase-like protein
MPKSHPPYPPEYRAEAMRLVRSSGQPVAQIAPVGGVCGDAAPVGAAGRSRRGPSS